MRTTLDTYLLLPFDHSHADLSSIKDGLIRLASASAKHNGNGVAGAGLGSPVTASFSQLKLRTTILQAQTPTNLLNVLDIAKAADIIVWVLPLHGGMDESVDEMGESVLTAVKSQGLPSSLCFTQGIKGLTGASHTAKQQKDLKKYAQVRGCLNWEGRKGGYINARIQHGPMGLCDMVFVIITNTFLSFGD
jgi:hypothetical protein